MSALVFEKSVSGRHTEYLPENTAVPVYALPEKDRRSLALDLPELSENDVSRHYTELEGKTHGVNDGFYPLGSCTMKYNPKVNEALAALPGFTDIHPLAPEDSVQGALKVLKTAEEYLTAITGMDRFTFQPAAGAHGEFTGLLLIKAYHLS
ncbi:MAG: aminomethyl-transferring glycine dehydrogenase subunit GcvPB, partial [Lachnospiraceae bacterium]|nr:aminomethyl-transferring glycine dehydrogenase subunit GcvPB [Lachnospiraceae bacterium]